MTSTDTLEGRVAIVTGGARGIGAAISEMLVARGASVIVADNGTSIDGRDKDPSVAEEFADKLGQRARPYVEDMAIPAAAKQAVELAVGELGGIDIVVNNAAILRNSFVFRASPDDWDAVIRNNLSAAYYLIGAASPVMREQARDGRGDGTSYGWGRIVNVVSTAAFYGSFGHAPYASSKGGLVSLTRIAALDMLRSGVTCNAVAPLAHTRVTESLEPATPEQEVFKEHTLKLPTGHVANLVAYLCAPAAQDVTGQIFGVRGREVSVYSRPRPAAREIAEADGGGWTVDALAASVDAELRPHFAGLATDAETFDTEPLV